MKPNNTVYESINSQDRIDSILDTTELNPKKDRSGLSAVCGFVMPLDLWHLWWTQRRDGPTGVPSCHHLCPPLAVLTFSRAQMCGHVPCRPLFTTRRRNALNSVNPNSFAEAGCLSPPHGPGPTSAGPGELIIDAHQLDSGRRQGPECRVHQALLGWQRMGRGSPRSSEHGPWLLSLAPPSGPISLCPGGCPRPWTQRSQHSLCVPEEGQRQSPLWCPSGSAVTCLAPQLPSCSSSGGQTDQIDP